MSEDTPRTAMDDFLQGSSPEPDAPEPVDPPEPTVAVEPAAPEPKVAAEPDDDGQAPEDRAGLLAALQNERRRRQDHKGRADTLEGELKAIRDELATLRAKPATPPPVAAPQPVARQPEPVPNPIEDPDGFVRWQERRRIDDRFDLSKSLMVDQIGEDKVAELENEFRALADRTPGMLIPPTVANPYKWVRDTVARAKAMEEIGTDPGAFRTKIEAETRAKVEAEFAARAPSSPARAAVNLPISLNGARSTNDPGTPEGWAGPTSLEDITDRRRRG